MISVHQKHLLSSNPRLKNWWPNWGHSLKPLNTIGCSVMYGGFQLGAGGLSWSSLMPRETQTSQTTTRLIGAFFPSSITGTHIDFRSLSKCDCDYNLPFSFGKTWNTAHSFGGFKKEHNGKLSSRTCSYRVFQFEMRRKSVSVGSLN